ncbi:MAG: hypothetical protein ACOWWO_09260 [Peptococcaceae bacterium]
MDITKLIEQEIAVIMREEKIKAAFLVGGAAEPGKVEQRRFNDIDIFLITNTTEYFRREIKIQGGIHFDLSYIPVFLLQKGFQEKWPFLVSSFRKFKTIFCREPEVLAIVENLQEAYHKGPDLLNKEEIDWIRFRLNEDYENLLQKKDDHLQASFLTHNLCAEILSCYFALNKKWTPKAKKILDTLSLEDEVLYNLYKRFVSQEQTDAKIKVLAEMLQYVLRNFEGVLRTWPRGKFPLK